ncbi:LacI family DNA-binding transcriptional regulator [Nocardioides jiangxiensis]|uniref:LacI family DNA-binding transcriptional regulator n=1 Tax=Nocardioides jiangxiensis TaxID=3064524 RepID=A0ABT9B3I3_9ACTN|nr:LacI family DNA-binding transcriptional regulator [Nocardioides sp. WY-20]MDO7868874.1 LacI family DNA-binding transcriptional regulator [Nocardioides sp. WY-20]
MGTLAEIAREAGVSEATVSRVLNAKPGVSAAARQHVLMALDVLGYERPTRLRRRSAGLVGLVVPELDNPIFPAIAQVIEDSLTQRRYTPVLCTQSPGGIAEDEYVESLLDHGVAGILFVSGRHADVGADHERYRALVGRGMPVAFINGYVEGIPAPFFSTDDAAATELAVAHLVQLGHRRIGLATGPGRFTPSLRKRAGFVAALNRLLGLTAQEAESWVEESLFTVEGGAASAASLVERGATGIVCASDMMAIGAVRGVRDAGLSVPGDVSVVGFDDSNLMGFLDPPLTTIRQPVHALCSAAVAAVADAIGGAPVPAREYVFKPELVLRQSTGPARPGA